MAGVTTLRTVITGATVLFGRDLEPVADAVVSLEDARIASVDAGGPHALDNADAVDGRGLTLLPGFIDAHVHIGFYDPHAVVAGGVTTVRDLGWPAERIFPLAERSRDPDFDGPTILAAGRILTAARGYPTRAAWAPERTGLVVTDAAGAVEGVAEMARAGAAVIKVALNPAAGPTLDATVLRAIVSAAHSHGLTVTGHVYGLEELHKALDDQMDELAHMLMSPERIPDPTLERMVTAGMTVVPTLGLFSGRTRRRALDNLRRFAVRGGRVVYGTDLGNAGVRPGIEPREIVALLAAGMTPRAIVASATTEAARWLRLADVGVIDAGRVADLVAVAGDPLTDGRDLMRVARVWRRGRLVFG